MAAGLGFKDFTTGEVLTAADVDGYLMQGVLVFASSAARDAAITSPQEGQFAFLKDTNTTMYYTGSAWTNLDTTGMVNPMTTTGDMIYSSPGSTPVRLGIGSAGQVLTVASGVPSWATAASGGKVLQVVNATYATTTTSTSATYADTGITATITPSSATSKVLVFASVNGIQKDGGSSGDLRMDLRLVKDSTQLIIFENRAGLTGNTNTNGVAGSSTTYLDSPATTSATVYKVQFARGDGNGNVRVQSDNCTSTITLMEIGA